MASRSWLLLLMSFVPLIVLLHLYIAPFTKVEESFNIQAIHDIVTYGFPKKDFFNSLRASYDHFTFPGSVPRTFVGALLLSWIAQPFQNYVSNPLHLQFLVRGLLGLVNASTIILLARAVWTQFGTTAAAWYLVLQMTQFHVVYYASRTLPNMFAFAFTTVAFRSYILASSSAISVETRAKRYRLCLYLLTISGVIFRAEIAVVLATTTAYAFLFKNVPLRGVIIPAGLFGVFVGLWLTIQVDSFLWWEFPMWPEWRAFYYNTIQGHASDWGISSWHYYFSSALPKLLYNPLIYTLFIPAALASPATRQRSIDILIPHILFLALYSLLPHKEWRFIIYSIPPITAVAASGASWIWTRRYKNLIYGVSSLAMLASVAACFGASLLQLAISSQNYPGGVAMQRLLEIIPKDGSAVRIHLDNLACQTGATRFLEYRPTNDGGADLESALPSRWVYDKTEDEERILRPEFWINFDYVVVEQPERAIGKWEIVDQVYAYAGVRLLKPEDASALSKHGDSGGLATNALIKIHNKVEALFRGPLLRGRWIEVRMEPKINILKKQPIDMDTVAI